MSQIILLSHPTFGVLAVLAAIWVFVDTLNANLGNRQRIRSAAWLVAIFLWLSYLAGGFKPDREAAEAILAWFDLHGQSERGEVPFRAWPNGMRGHFIARLPPGSEEPS